MPQGREFATVVGINPRCNLDDPSGFTTSVAVGPGLSAAAGISALVMRLLQTLEVPAVIDADGLNILAKDPSGAGRISAPIVFSPTPARWRGCRTRPSPMDRPIALASPIFLPRLLKEWSAQLSTRPQKTNLFTLHALYNIEIGLLCSIAGV